MKWIKIAIHTTTEAVDFISNLFDELGLEGIQIEDHVPLSEEDKQAMFLEDVEETAFFMGEDDQTAVVSSYIAPKENIEDLVNKIKEGLEEISIFADIGAGTVTITEADDANWINNWKKYFKAFWVADDILIKPTWEKMEEQKGNPIVIEIDPGTAFGTGAHETTRLCIDGLREYMKKDAKVLDIGCGSGILSIISLKLGASYTVGTDIDPAAIKAVYENMEVNNILQNSYHIYAGNLIEDTQLQKEIGMEQYDVAVANILADVIIPLSKVIGQHIKSDGYFITSGIINTKKEEVKKALETNGFCIAEVKEMKDWVSFICRKNK